MMQTWNIDSVTPNQNTTTYPKQSVLSSYLRVQTRDSRLIQRVSTSHKNLGNMMPKLKVTDRSMMNSTGAGFKMHVKPLEKTPGREVKGNNIGTYDDQSEDKYQL